MPVPARRHSRSRVRRRRAHDAMKPQNVGLCMTCNVPILAHRACANCGSYKGKQVLDVSRKMKRVAKKVSSRNASMDKKPESASSKEARP